MPTKKAKKTEIPTDVLLLMCLDKSGSMGERRYYPDSDGPVSVRDATIEGFNTVLADQQAQPGNAYMSLTLFNTMFDVRYVAQDVHEVANLGSMENPYQPGGGTNLYDAVGVTIRGGEEWLKNNPNFDGRVIVTILTDGEHNTWGQWQLGVLNTLIEQKQREGWSFVFLGAGGSAWTEGAKFTALAPQQVFNHVGSAQSTSDTYAMFSSSVSATRASGIGYSTLNADPSLIASATAGMSDEEKAKWATPVDTSGKSSS